MAVQTKRYITPEEYLITERAAEVKSEYYRGEIFAMSGASYNHNLIAANLLGLLYSLRKNGCQAFGSDLRLHIPLSGLYTYPDITIICEKPEFLDQQQDTITNPSVLIEILSPSTEKYDRGKKFRLYRSIPNLQEYILIDSQYQLIEKYTHTPDNHWVLSDYKQPEDTVMFTSIDFKLSVREIYSGTVGLAAL